MRTLIFALFLAVSAAAQVSPPIEPGVSQELAKWRAARYSDIRYKLNLTLEKMSPVLKGTIEIRVIHSVMIETEPMPKYIVLDWRKINGHEKLSTITNVTLNGKPASLAEHVTDPCTVRCGSTVRYEERNEHLTFSEGVGFGENVIKLDFTSPILTSGSAITRYIDKEDGSEYIYSLFVPSDASTAFPVFDQPDLKARFTLNLSTPDDWRVVSNTFHTEQPIGAPPEFTRMPSGRRHYEFAETKPISTYLFAFAVGPWGQFTDLEKDYGMVKKAEFPVETRIFVRKSQYVKASDHTSDVFRLNREAIKYFEQYFDYKFPFPKYDLVLIPEFPFGGMEHAGATFLRESAIIFPQEPTKGDVISRANLIFHEAAHQWFGDTVTMRWFDDLWLKEGFATFMAYKALERVMPEANAWKVFYERVKQAAYQTDSTKGTTAIYQPIANLSAAKSAYGNIVYNKAPAFLRQAEFYLGEDKFQTAVRAFLKKNEFGNAGWEDLVKELKQASNYEQNTRRSFDDWASRWVKDRGLLRIRYEVFRRPDDRKPFCWTTQENVLKEAAWWESRFRLAVINPNKKGEVLSCFTMQTNLDLSTRQSVQVMSRMEKYDYLAAFPNYGDFGYGIFLLDEKSRKFVLNNIASESDPFLRSMMWGALWDSVREGELDPKVYVELALKQLGNSDAQARTPVRAETKDRTTETDETIVASLLSRVSLALNYYLRTSDTALTGVRASAMRFEDVLIERMQNSPSAGQRITFYRAFVNNAASDRARSVLKDVLNLKFEISDLKLKTKDKFDIVTRLLIMNDPDAPRLLAELEKTETSDDAKRYAYAARAGIPTAENKAKYWDDFVNNKEISESWIEAAFGPWNSIRHSELTRPYLERALKELPNHKRSRKIFFVNGWLGAFIGGQRDQRALDIINKFLADNPTLDNDLRLKILENMDLIERAVKIRNKYKN